MFFARRVSWAVCKWRCFFAFYIRVGFLKKWVNNGSSHSSCSMSFSFVVNLCCKTKYCFCVLRCGVGDSASRRD